MTYSQLYTELVKALSFRENPLNESRWLVEFLAGDKFLNIQNAPVEDHAIKYTENAVAQLRNGVPFQYVIGETDFYGLTFKVNENVLIPRSETELLVETAVAWGRSLDIPLRVLDVCTGSGCIVVSLAKNLKGTFVAGDISPLALETAKTNSLINGVDIDFRQGDLLGILEEGEVFNIITANPPYLTNRDMEEIPKDVTYEPSLALYGGNDGLDLCRKLISQVPVHLGTPGIFLMEIGETQGDPVLSLAKDYFAHSMIKEDLSGRPRFLVASQEDLEKI